MTDTNTQNGSESSNPSGVLNTIKKMLGHYPSETEFDTDITVYINSAFFNLKQLGVGPDEGFRISGASDGWEGFVPVESPSYDAVKNYLYFKCRLAHDPPTTSFAIQAIKDQITELEFRLGVEFDTEVPSARVTN